MAKLSKKRLIAYVALTGNVLVWGAALTIVKRGFQDGLSPFTFLFARMFLATVFSLPLIFLIRNQPSVKSTFKLSNILNISLHELLGSVIALTALYLGLQKTTGVDANIISAMWPVMLTIGGIYFLHEKEQRHEAVGLVISLLGTILLVGLPAGRQAAHLSGNTLVFLYSLINAVYLLLAKKAYARLNKWVVTFVSFVVSTFGFGLIMLYFGENPLLFLTSGLWHLSFWPLIAILYMSTFGSIVGLSLYLIGQDKIEASEAALFSYLYPIIGIPTSILLLHESINPLDIVALTVIFLGVFLASKR